MLVCTKCRNGLTESRGCVFCEDFKRNFITIVDDGVKLKATDIGNRGLKVITAELAKLENNLNESEEYNPILNRELQIVLKSLTMLMDSVRKLTDSEDKNGETTFDEQKAIFIEWLGDLPVMLRKSVLSVINSTFQADQVAGYQ